MKKILSVAISILLAFGILLGFAYSVGLIPRPPSFARFVSLIDLATRWADSDSLQRFEFYRAVFTGVADTIYLLQNDVQYETYAYYLTDVEPQYSTIIAYFTVDTGYAVRTVYNPFGTRIAMGSDSAPEKKAMYYAQNIAYDGLWLLYNWESYISSADTAFERWLLRQVSRLFLLTVVLAEIMYVVIDVAFGSIIEICYVMSDYLDWLFAPPDS